MLLIQELLQPPAIARLLLVLADLGLLKSAQVRKNRDGVACDDARRWFASSLHSRRAGTLLVPGPAVLYIVARSVDQGRTAGFVSVVGVGLGSMVHVVAAALGLSALLVQSATAFRTVKYLGAAYLVYLGIRRLLGKDDVVAGSDASERTLRLVFVQGIWVNILNPKTALFFFAFLPQFVNVDGASVALQILFLGALLVTMGIVTDGAYALAAGTLGGWLKERPRVIKVQRWFAGGVFISLGLATALSGGKD